MIPGTSVRGRATLTAGDSLDDAQRVRVVVVRPEDHLEEDAHGGDQERRQQRPAEVVDHEGVVQQIRRELENEGVEDQDEHEAEREHERETQRGEQRREQRVQHGDHGGHGERAAVPRDVDTGQDHRRHPERHGGQRPRQQHAERLEPRPLGLPGDGLPVWGGGGGVMEATSSVLMAAILAIRHRSPPGFRQSIIPPPSARHHPNSVIRPLF